MHVANGNQEKQSQDRIRIIALFLFLSRFYLTGFSNIYIKDWRWWLLIDYASVKLFRLLVVLWLIRSR